MNTKKFAKELLLRLLIYLGLVILFATINVLFWLSKYFKLKWLQIFFFFSSEIRCLQITSRGAKLLSFLLAISVLSNFFLKTYFQKQASWWAPETYVLIIKIGGNRSFWYRHDWRLNVSLENINSMSCPGWIACG